MTNQQILRIAKEQSAIDLNCKPDDFDRHDPVIVSKICNGTGSGNNQFPHNSF